MPFLLLVGISLVSTVAAADDSGQVMRRALLCALVAIVGMAVGGVIRRAYARGGRDGTTAHGLPGQLRYFGYTLLYIANLLLFVEIGLRVLGMSLAGLMEAAVRNSARAR